MKRGISPRLESSDLQRLLAHDAMGGALLLFAAILALLLANWPAEAISNGYAQFTHAQIGPASLHFIVNDGLMALFFLLVGLEIKAEVKGSSGWRDQILPVIAAAGGMLVPALIYLTLAGPDPALQAGWAVPAATDIAFALAILRLAGKGLPPSLRLLLSGIAIADDIGAIVIIAIAYTAHINGLALLIAALLFSVMLMLNRSGVARLWPYLLLGGLLWIAVLLSGVHATIAGVLTAFAIPHRKNEDQSPLRRLEHSLNPWVGLAIVPLFGFLNAGVAIGANWRTIATDPVPIAVAAGLFIGKQIGVFGCIVAAIKLGLTKRPEDTRWSQLYGVSLLCGIGFTMSLFIGGLAFPDPSHLDDVKIGVLAGSLLSGLSGLAALKLSASSPSKPAAV